MAIEPIVIKFGGDVLEDEIGFKNLLQSVSQLYKQQEKLILIHGGGPQATALSKKLGITPKKVGGRRVTDADTLEVVKMILPGVCNSNILARLQSYNLPAVSVSAMSIIQATKRPPKQVSGSSEIVDFGFVGDVQSCEPQLLFTLLQNKYLPVVSPLSVDKQGTMLNINADTVASHIALATKAKALILVTKVGGVFEDITNPNSRLQKLSIENAKQKIADKVIVGGMIPKIEESFKLLNGSVQAVHIVGVDTPSSIYNELNIPGSIGTAITAT